MSWHRYIVASGAFKRTFFRSPQMFISFAVPPSHDDCYWTMRDVVNEMEDGVAYLGYNADLTLSHPLRPQRDEKRWTRAFLQRWGAKDGLLPPILPLTLQFLGIKIASTDWRYLQIHTRFMRVTVSRIGSKVGVGVSCSASQMPAGCISILRLTKASNQCLRAYLSRIKAIFRSIVERMEWSGVAQQCNGGLYQPEIVVNPDVVDLASEEPLSKIGWAKIRPDQLRSQWRIFEERGRRGGRVVVEPENRIFTAYRSSGIWTSSLGCNYVQMGFVPQGQRFNLGSSMELQYWILEYSYSMDTAARRPRINKGEIMQIQGLTAA
ncbi:unnamed protein product [Nesidiocoris tenuis]|uniref:Uncharacterized protein n=1 Tax=Nesidiocoris tenuis TaxID=355587 RepID=A0A6H5GX66_9HEMI|nr:unnamed protein product [Nesidiocoris tenuis]